MDRFDLEQAIMASWGTADDIKLIMKMYCDRPEEMGIDELSNLLIGLECQHNLRSQELFSIFEKLVQEKIITNSGIE